MKQSLLSHIATNFISEYENVANSSIAYLLNQYDIARVALKNILVVESVPTHYITELSTDGNGRPDVTGLNPDGTKSIIIEGKFWANLTNNQPINYLKELSDTGKLLFVAPDRRTTSLRYEIQERTGKDDERIIVVSWRSFIEAIELENQKNLNVNLASDLTQLKELCEQMDEAGMPPLSMSDLDPMNGRVAYQFADLLDECNTIIRGWPESDFKGLLTASSKDGYGFYFRAFNHGCQLKFSSYDWFMKDSHTPFWLRLKDVDFNHSESIYIALNNIDEENTYLDSDYVSYAIKLNPGMDRDEVIQHIVFKVRDVLIKISEK